MVAPKSAATMPIWNWEPMSRIAFFITRSIFSLLERRRNVLGFRDRPRVPEEAGLGRRIRARGGRAAGSGVGARAVRAPGGAAARGDSTAQGAGAAAGAVGDASGPRTRRPGIRAAEA